MDRGAWQATIRGVAKSQTEMDLARTQRHQKVCTEQFISTNSLSAVFLYFIPIFSWLDQLLI